MHRDHPPGIQIEKGPGGVSGAGVDVAELLGIVGADRQERQLRRQAAPDFAKAVEVGGIAGVVDRMLAAAQHVAPVAAMRILYNPRSPMPRGDMRDVERAVAIRVPPLQFHNFLEAQVGDKIEKMMRHYQRGCCPRLAAGEPRYGAQRLAMQVIEVGVGYQDQVCRGQIAQVQAGLAQPLQHEKPACKVGVDDDVLSADLQEETGMSDEGNPEFTVRNQRGLVRLASAGRDGGMPHQPRELACALAQSGIS